MRVLAMMKYGRVAASTRQRLLQYLPDLAREGITVDVQPLLDDDYLRRYAKGQSQPRMAVARAYARRLRQLLTRSDHDALWVQYELFPYLPGLFERLSGLFGKPIIVDFDDATFHMYDHHRRALVRTLLGTKLAPLLGRASLCICGNTYLQAYAQRYCPNSIVIPTVVDTDEYRPVAKQGGRRAPIVGWIGSPSTWRYVAPLLPTLLPVLARHGARFRAVGAGPAADGIAGVENVAWTEEGEVREVQNMDIGIMPVPDEPWERGKCGYKLIQYMACGHPVVGSPVGVNAEIVTDGEHGFLARDEDGWRHALDTLLADPRLRRTMGDKGRARAVERYSLQSQFPRLIAALHSAIRNAEADQAGRQPFASL